MFEQIKSKENIVKAQSVDKDTILKFENELNISFGAEYKQFLTEFGCLSIEYLEFYGICGKNKSAPSAIYVTKKMREDLDFFPENLLVIHEVGDGTFYCVDADDDIYFCTYRDCKKAEDKFEKFITEKIDKL